MLDILLQNTDTIIPGNVFEDISMYVFALKN